MRVRRGAILSAMVLAGLFPVGRAIASAQDDPYMMPEQSEAKARELINQAVEALGGSAYLNIKDSTCTGRLSTFDHSGETTGFGKFIDYEQPPDKERQENLPKHNIISVFNGDKGWDLDRGGVSDARTSDLMQYQEDLKKDIDNILRHRIHEKDMIFRYGGPDVVDLKEADWVELVDSDNRTIRIAIAKSSHLPIRKVVDTRDANTRMRAEEIEYYSNYHPFSGIETPFQITRDRNGIKIYQVFFDKCDYNTNIPESLFTKESLDERWDKVGKKSKDKKSKSKDAEN